MATSTTAQSEMQIPTSLDKVQEIRDFSKNLKIHFEEYSTAETAFRSLMYGSKYYHPLHQEKSDLQKIEQGMKPLQEALSNLRQDRVKYTKLLEDQIGPSEEAHSLVASMEHDFATKWDHVRESLLLIDAHFHEYSVSEKHGLGVSYDTKTMIKRVKGYMLEFVESLGVWSQNPQSSVAENKASSAALHLLITASALSRRQWPLDNDVLRRPLEEIIGAIGPSFEIKGGALFLDVFSFHKTLQEDIASLFPDQNILSRVTSILPSSKNSRNNSFKLDADGVSALSSGFKELQPKFQEQFDKALETCPV